jgi:hypothetical protein
MNMDNRVSQKLKNEILKIINNPQCSEWFAEESGIKTEQEIILPDGEVLRPDRIIFREDKTIVIDFKTGKYHDSHKSQVSRYAEAMIKAGLKNVNKYLYYIGREEVIKF